MLNALETTAIELRFREILHEKDQHITMLEGEMGVLKEQLAWMKKQIFGAKSERFIDLESQPLLDFGLGNPTPQPEPEKQEVRYNRKKSSKNRGSDTISFPDNLPVRRVELIVPPEDRICPETGQPLVYIGSDISRKLGRTAEQFFIIEYVRPKYASKAAPDLGIVTAALPDAVIPRCPADESLLAYILTSKFADHLPLYRQVEILQRADIKISRQTLSKWVLTLGAALSPIYDMMREQVLASEAIFSDETPILLQVRGKSRCQKAYMWIYVGGGGGDPPYRFFEFCLNRNHEHPLKTLKHYKGYLHTDKYGAYEKLALVEGIVWCPCMAHVRRYFVEADGGADKELLRRILRKIRHLFMLERVAWARSDEERLRIRDKIEKPVLEQLTQMVQERILAGGLIPRSSLAKALHYYQGLAPYLPNYLKHPDARLDNNVSERGIRPLTVGRKNWLFVGSEDGGRAAATVLSLVQTCRNLNINPQEYLEDVLRRIMGHPAKHLAELLPDKWLAARNNATIQPSLQDGLS
jgi:transposase